MNIDWSKAPEGTMGFHPLADGYVDHWVKWSENGDHWFCVCGFELGGWVRSYPSLHRMSPSYRAAIIERPVQNKAAVYLEVQYTAWQEYANNFRQTTGVQSAEEARLRGEISMQVFFAGFDAGVKASRP